MSTNCHVSNSDNGTIGPSNKPVKQQDNWKPPVFIETQFESRTDYEAWVASFHKKGNYIEDLVPNDIEVASNEIEVVSKGLDIVTKKSNIEVNDPDIIDIYRGNEDVSGMMMDFWAGVGSEGDVEGRVAAMIDSVLGT